MEGQGHSGAGQRGRTAQQALFQAAAEHHPQHHGDHGVHVADLVGAAGNKGQHPGSHAPAAMTGILQPQQAQPARHGPEQGLLGDSVVAVHALIVKRSQRQSQRKTAQCHRVAAAEFCDHPAGQEPGRGGHGDDIQPVAGQIAEKQQRKRRGVMEREKPDLMQGKIFQPFAQVPPEVFPEGHAVEIEHPFVQGQFVVALRRYADGDAQIHHGKSQDQQVSGRQQQPAVPPAKGGKGIHQGPPCPGIQKYTLL